MRFNRKALRPSGRQMVYINSPDAIMKNAAAPPLVKALTDQSFAEMPSTYPAEIAILAEHVTKDFSLAKQRRRRSVAGTPPVSFHRAVDNVSFTVRRGETVGLLGINGAGKSTLLQLITGTLSPTQGQIKVFGRISALLELGAGFNMDWSGRQNAEFQSLIHGAQKFDMLAILKRIEDFAEIGDFFDQPMKSYSSGMFARVAFATAIATEPDILIVDEALAVGDARFQNKCFAHFRQLQEMGKTILFVSHAIDMVAQFCTRGIVVDHGRVAFDGPADVAAAAYLKLLYGPNTAPVTLPPRTAATGGDIGGETTAKVIAKLFCWPPDNSALSQRGFFNPYSTSAGKVVGHVVDVLVLDLNNQPILGPIQSGRRFRISMQIVSEETIRRPRVGLSIKTKDNTLVYSVTNNMLGQELPPLQPGEPLVAVFEIDNPLAPGDYFADVGLADLYQDILHTIEWRVSLLHLHVTSTSEHYGLVDLEAAFASTYPK
jgi:lipopolysaccharide transport system ATP-binding protein